MLGWRIDPRMSWLKDAGVGRWWVDPPSLQDVSIWKSCHALPGMEHLHGCPLRGKMGLRGTCPPGVGAACSLGISPGRFLQICSILPNTIPMPTERKSHCSNGEENQQNQEVWKAGFTRAPFGWYQAAKAQKWFS